MARFNRRRSDETDHLNDYLDDLASGVLAPRNAIDPDMAATVSQVHQTGSHTAPPRGLKADVWEELMSTATYPDSGSLAAPLPPKQQRRRATTTTHAGGNGVQTPRQIPASQRFQPLRWAVAALVLLGIAGSGFIVQQMQNGAPPPTEQAALMAPTFGSPVAQPMPDGTTYPPASDCTVPVLRINEISAIAQAAVEGWDRQNSMRDLPLTPSDMVPSSPPLPDGEPVDEETAAAINDVYHTYIACSNAGSIRQQYWLFTNDAIARDLVPNGKPAIYSIALLGVEPTPVTGNAVPMIPFTDLRLLPDGRVAGILVEPGDPDNVGATSYILFKEINGQWYIDDTYCGVCG